MPRGRPAQYAKGRDGKPITGLSISSQGRYYATHSKPRKTFGRDFDQAVMRFRQWEATQKRHGVIRLPNLLPLIPKEDQEASVAEGWITMEDASKLLPWPGMSRVPEDEFYSTVRGLIQQNPAQFAERIGIPEIAHLQDIPKPEPPTKLSDCIKEYEKKRRRPSAAPWPGCWPRLRPVPA